MVLSRALLKPLDVGRPIKRQWSWVRRLRASKIAVAYLGAITMAEVITALISPMWGVIFHLMIFANLLVHAGLSNRPWERNLYLSLGIAPIIRIVSLGMPLGYFPQEWWYVLTSIPLFATAFVITRTVPLNRREIGLQLPERTQLPLTYIVAATGIPLGIIEYAILRPTPVVPSFNWPQVLLASLILMVGTGFVEELIFRGVLQATVSEIYDPGLAIVYVSVLFGALHTGHMSVIDVIFVIGVALYFGAVVHKSRTLLGVSIAHGLTNIMLFVVLPLAHLL